jgi:hypothetical protein
MLDVLRVLTVVLVVVAMAPALAHALEWLGKRRVAKGVYFAMQQTWLTHRRSSSLLVP